MYKILAVDPGSTSTKIAIYEDTKEICRKNIEHSSSEIQEYKHIADQFEMRYKAIMDFLVGINFDVNELSAVVGRGGQLPPVKSGAYRINKKMVDRQRFNPVVEHASNLGAVIAYEIAQPLGIPSYIYDAVSVDELEDIARVSGMADIERKSFSHVLNMRAVAMKLSKKIGRDYSDMNFIIAHIGGGVSLSVHSMGRMIDVVADDEGPFSPERAGSVPCIDLINMCYKYDRNAMQKKLRGKGGLLSYLNTSDCVEVERRINNGDKHAELIYRAMAYQIAKSIGELATVVCGNVDRIIITGGAAYSEMLTGWIKKRVQFIAPVVVMPGENELESLAAGALRVLKGEEKANEYDID